MATVLRRPAAIVTILAALLLAGALSACGGEVDHHEVTEGEAAIIGELEYDVQITRFLNPADVEDAEYLVSMPQPPTGEGYMGVFLTVANQSDERDLRSSDDYSLLDIRGNRFEPLETESPFGFDVGARVPAGGQVPHPDSMAAIGPAAGGVLVFQVDDEISQRLPLTLEINAEGETATVQLDI